MFNSRVLSLVSKKITIQSHYLILILAAYFSVILNLPFYRETWHVLSQAVGVKTGFLISIPLFIFSALTLIFSLFVWKGTSKFIFSVLLITSSLVAYAGWSYGAVFDYGMIENAAQTNTSEATSYLNLSFIATFLLTGILPTLLLLKVKIIYRVWWKELLTHLGVMLCAVAALGAIASLYYQDYASVGRNNKFLQKYIVPSQYVWSSYRYIKLTYFTKPRAYEQLGLDAKYQPPASVQKPKMMVMVLGETARTMNYAYNGYSRDTNPYTQGESVYSFRHVSTCGTATAVSVPCMFSFMTRAQYDGSVAPIQDNAVDILKRAGFNLHWIDNDGGCKGVCKNIPTLDIDVKQKSPDCDGTYCIDNVMLGELKKQILAANHQNTMITIHLIGSHGPTYFRRYPDSQKKFMPDCARSDIQNCTHDELVNTYDNTIVYTDFILKQVIDMLKDQSANYDTSMLYMSDHGESLGESGLYLHGTPYAIAPKEQTHVPAILWLSPNYIAAEGIDTGCLTKATKDAEISHDFLSHTLLGMNDVKTELHQPKLDFVSACKRVS